VPSPDSPIDHRSCTDDLKRLCETLGWEHRMHQHREYWSRNALVIVDAGEAHFEAYGRSIEDACGHILTALKAAANACR
jgi:hypothetical protein